MNFLRELLLDVELWLGKAIAAGTPMVGAAFRSISRFFGYLLASGYGGPLITLVIVAALWVLYKLSTKAARAHVASRAEKPEDVQNFMLLWRYAWIGVALILVFVSFSGSLVGLGISAGFLGMMLGWSLQAPVTGIAAWLMIILKRPFKIGDRVIIAGIIGDVTDINLTHIVLNQVGGTIGGEEKSGRGVLIPNATLFQQVIYNYTLDSKYILDEVPVLITFESDLDEAERLLVSAAHDVTRDVIEETGQEPFIRVEFTEWGLRLRLRYQALAVERQRVSSDMVRIIFREIRKSQRVEYCYPHTEVLYRQKDEASSVPPFVVGGKETR